MHPENQLSIGRQCVLTLASVIYILVALLRMTYLERADARGHSGGGTVAT